MSRLGRLDPREDDPLAFRIEFVPGEEEGTIRRDGERD